MLVCVGTIDFPLHDHLKSFCDRVRSIEHSIPEISVLTVDTHLTLSFNLTLSSRPWVMMEAAFLTGEIW